MNEYRVKYIYEITICYAGNMLIDATTKCIPKQ